MPVPEQYAIFPVINASLNGASTILLLVGRWFIAQRRIAAHRGTMISALVTSTLFLASYLYYHAHVGSVRFQGTGWSRPVYFTVLISHVILAIVIVPLVIITLTARCASVLTVTAPLPAGLFLCGFTFPSRGFLFTLCSTTGSRGDWGIAFGGEKLLTAKAAKTGREGARRTTKSLGRAMKSYEEL